MKRETKIAIQYMLFVWIFTTCLAFMVNCAPRHGTDGAPGAPGANAETPAPSPYDVVEIIDPCGKQAAYDEVILRMNNGSLLAHYSDGKKQFFALIGPGSYVSTDGTLCSFTVDANGVVRW